MPGTRATSGRSFGTCSTPASTRAKSIRVFPLSNWTELDIWQYIHAESIPVVPLYFAKKRPVVRRSGTWIMVDDEPLPLVPGETPEMRLVRFRTLGCYPLTRRHRIRCRHVGRHRRGDEGRTGLGAPRPADRQRRNRLDGKERNARAISDAIVASPRLLWRRATGKDLLRFITCGSVDDGKSTLDRPAAARYRN